MKPETYPRCKKLINDYVENDRIYDFIKYTVGQNVKVYNNAMRLCQNA